MKKLLVPLAVILFLALAVPSFADWELGMGITPAHNTDATTTQVDAIINFHVAYAYSILYFAWDAYAMPDYWVYNATSYYDTLGNFYPGQDVPGFLNTFDVGARIILRPIVIYGTIGPNMLYLYGGQLYNGVGVNARLGVGLRFGFWGVNVSGTQVFANWSDMEGAFSEAFHGNTGALTAGSELSLNFVLYF